MTLINSDILTVVLEMTHVLLVTCLQLTSNFLPRWKEKVVVVNHARQKWK